MVLWSKQPTHLAPLSLFLQRPLQQHRCLGSPFQRLDPLGAQLRSGRLKHARHTADANAKAVLLAQRQLGILLGRDFTACQVEGANRLSTLRSVVL